MDREKQVAEMKRDIAEFWANGDFDKVVEEFINLGYHKINDNEVVISKEEYDELMSLQLTHAEDLTNAIQSYEEKKADLKLEYNNHIKNLEKIIDRQNKDLNSQADRLIDLKEQLKEMEEQRDKQAYITEDLIQEKHRWTEQTRKETAREILRDLYYEATSNITDTIELTILQIEELAEKYGVDLGLENGKV